MYRLVTKLNELRDNLQRQVTSINEGNVCSDGEKRDRFRDDEFQIHRQLLLTIYLI